jgi:hypothetical protein
MHPLLKEKTRDHLKGIPLDSGLFREDFEHP